MVSGLARRIMPRNRATWLAALLFAALTILCAYPISLHPSSLRFSTGPDGDLGWYLLGWDTHAFLHRPWAIFDANIYYPERLTLAYGENVIGIAFFAAPVIWLGGNLLLAANFVCLLSTALCGLGAYVLARRLHISVAGAVICGIIFQCSPPRFLRIGQMNLSSVQWIPFTLAALHAYFETGRRRDLWLAAGFITLQTLSSGHGAIFLAVTLLVFGLYRFFLGEPLQLVRRARDLGLVGFALLVPAVLVFLPYRAVQHQVGLRRGLGTWVANHQSFLASPSHVHQYLLELFGRTDVNATASAFLFPGYLPLILACVALLWHGRTRGAARAPAVPTSRAVFLEATIPMAAAVAAVLTLGTLFSENAGLSRMIAPRTAAVGWMLVIAMAAVALTVRRRLGPDVIARHRRPLALLLAAALGWLILGAVRPTLRAGDGLLGEYFRNAEWEGQPALSVADTELSTARLAQRWNGAVPDRFSVRWMGFLTVPRSNLYQFSLTSDDGSELVIDNRIIIGNSGVHGPENRTGSASLDRGTHAVAVRYVQFGGGYALDWSWATGGAPFTAVPGWALSQRKARSSAVLALRTADWGARGFAILAVLAAGWYLRVALTRPRSQLADWTRARLHDATTFYAVLTAAMLWLALGPPFGVWRFLYWLPGFSFIRANSRFTLVALLGLAVLAGIGFDKVAAGVARRTRVLLASAAAILLVAEFAVMPMAVQPSNFEIPGIDRWLATRAKPFVVAEVPVYDQETNLGAFERQEVNFMIHSTAHWQKTVHGYSGWRTDFHRRLYEEMESFPDERSLASLADLGVTYVVVHADRYPPGEWTEVEGRLRRFSSRLRLERVEDGGRVYSLAGTRTPGRPPA